MRKRTNSSSVAFRPMASSRPARSLSRSSSFSSSTGDKSFLVFIFSCQASPKALLYTQSAGQPFGNCPYWPRIRFRKSSEALRKNISSSSCSSLSIDSKLCSLSMTNLTRSPIKCFTPALPFSFAYLFTTPLQVTQVICDPGVTSK